MQGQNYLQMLYFRLFDCDDLPITDMPCEESFTLTEDSTVMDKTESEMVCLKRIHAYTLLLDVTGSVQSIFTLVIEAAKKFVSYIFDADCRADKVSITPSSFCAANAPPPIPSCLVAHIAVTSPMTTFSLCQRLGLPPGVFNCCIRWRSRPLVPEGFPNLKKSGHEGGGLESSGRRGGKRIKVF